MELCFKYKSLFLILPHRISMLMPDLKKLTCNEIGFSMPGFTIILLHLNC